MAEFLAVDGHQVRVTNLDKVFWPQEGYTKGDLIKYYIEMSPYILPYIKDRPLVMSRYPEGITGDFFYHKHLIKEQVPPFLKTKTLFSKERKNGINYLVGEGVETLIYQANLGAIELHPWFSRIQSLKNPDWAIFDLDPAEGVTFENTITVARLIHQVLTELGLDHYPKTSGATGLHIYVPLEPIYSYQQVQKFVEMVGWIVVQVIPEQATIYDRRVKDRGGKVYIDYLQNSNGKTITGVYSLRPRPGAPISTPLDWTEVKVGLKPDIFNLQTIQKRINRVGDLFEPILTNKQRIDQQLADLYEEIKALN